MASIAIELYKGKTLADGRHPVRIRVTASGKKPKFKSIASALPDEWDDKVKRIIPRKRKDYAIINDDIDTAWEKYRREFKRLQESGKAWDPEDVFKEQKISSVYFKANAYEYITTLKGHGKLSVESRIAKILRFTNDQDFELEEINEKWLTRFKHHCKTNEKSKKKGEIGNSDNTINMAIKLLKRVCSYAGVSPNDLRKTKIRFSKTIKRKLSLAEIESFKNVELKPGTNAWHSKNFFLLMYYFRGMRVGDGLILEWSDIEGDRLKYDSSKTSHEYDMHIVEEAQEILKLYDKSTKYVFPFFKWRYNTHLSPQENDKSLMNALKSCTSLINGHLADIAKAAGINKPVSTHINRHSFASNADEALGGDVKLIQHLLGHKSRKITEGYLADIRQTDALDEAATKIFSKKQKPSE